MRQCPPLTIILLEAAVAVVIFATSTPSAAQSSIGTSSRPVYSPPYPVPAPRPALRPLDGTPRSGVTYREARGGYVSPRTDLGVSSHEPTVGPAIWSGLYAGLHGGYGFGQTRIQDSRLGTTDTSGGFAGVHLGRNWQTGAFVFGLEADASASLADGKRSFASGFQVDTTRDWTASARARAGLAFGSWLAYGTAGIAFAGQTTTATEGTQAWRAPEIYHGYVYGGGLEWQATDRISLRGEVLRFEFNDRTINVGGAAVPLQLDETVVRGGVSFRFN